MTDKEIKRALRCISCNQTVIADDTFVFDIPTGRLLDQIVVSSDANQTLIIGTTLAGTQIANSVALTGGIPVVFTTALYEGTVYITGPMTTTSFKFYLR